MIKFEENISYQLEDSFKNFQVIGITRKINNTIEIQLNIENANISIYIGNPSSISINSSTNLNIQELFNYSNSILPIILEKINFKDEKLNS